MLNLLPPQLKHEQSLSKSFARWGTALSVLAALSMITAAGLVVAKLALEHRAAVIARQLESLQRQAAKDSGTDITATTNALNATIRSLGLVLGTPQAWDSQVAMVISALPKDVVISDLSLQAGNKFHIVGIANTRQVFLELDAAMKNNPHFSHVVTTSTASKRQSVPFDYSGIVVTPTP